MAARNMPVGQGSRGGDTPGASAEVKPERDEIRSMWVLGARVTWVLFGPMVLMLICLGIISRGNGWLTVLDAAFAVVAALMILGRWVEYRSGTATTVTGQPATAAQYHRYMAGLPVAAVILWVAANVLGNHVLA